MAADSSLGISTTESEQLSDEQTRVLRTVLAGKNIFFTGSAGTGKSFILRKCVNVLRQRHKKKTVFVTAPAGIAACNVGGTTLHSFAGIGKGESPQWELIEQVAKNKPARQRWKRCQVLVIDEISMLNAELFDTLEAIARHIRNTTKPFGGIHLVLCGDFFQLPPVVKKSSQRAQTTTDTPLFCFDADTWSECVQQSIVLQKPFRQDDNTFIHLLNEMREGRVSKDTEQTLQDAGRTVQSLYDEGSDIQPTRLYALNKDVDRINNVRLQECHGEERTFSAKDTGHSPFLHQLQSNCAAPSELTLRVGAQVILLKNIDPSRDLVNGTRGTVVSFQTTETDKRDPTAVQYPYVKFLTPTNTYVYETVVPQVWTIEQGGESMAQRQQLPLKLAYALSIHKSQGMTVDLMECSFKGVFEYGQAYVALSRATSLDRLLVRDFSSRVIRTHPRVVEYYQSLSSTFVLDESLSCCTQQSTVTNTFDTNTKSTNSGDHTLLAEDCHTNNEDPPSRIASLYNSFAYKNADQTAIDSSPKRQKTEK